MAPSYRNIDYRLRPAKHAERLMLCEAFRRIRFVALEDYQYVGLGSVYFADFRLFHRMLGVARMVSIEKQAHDKERFVWNKPFQSIEMLFGATQERLTDIDLSRPTIAWLDYDGAMTDGVVSDVRTIAHSACHGSVLVVTVNAHPRQADSTGADMLEQVRAEIGATRVPAATTLESLRSWGLANLCRRVVDSEIRDALSNANGVSPKSSRRSYKQLFYFQYEDGARMATIGGVFFESNRRDEFDACAFDRLSFVREGDDAYRISAPRLTLREMAHLERQLPLAEGASLDPGPIPQADADAYGRMYRFLPAYLPVDLL